MRESFDCVWTEDDPCVPGSELKKLVRLSADTLNKEEPGAVGCGVCGYDDTVALFTLRNHQHVRGCLQSHQYLCGDLVPEPGLALLLVVLIPVIFAFTRIVQKQMLTAQLENRAAMSRVTNHVPETIRCIRTIHTLGKETYGEKV